MGDLHRNKEVFHRQVSIIERFATTRGQAAVCIEYLPYSSQKSLDLYISGEIDRRTFIADSVEKLSVRATAINLTEHHSKKWRYRK